MTLWNSLKFQGCKIWDSFNFCPDMVKRSQILRLQNMGPFRFLSLHGETVSNFAAAKYGTVSIFVLTWQNSLKFSSCKIWDCFNFCCGTVLIFCPDMVSNFADCFNFCLDTAKRSQILQPQNMGPFQFLSWHGETVPNFAATKYGTVSIFVFNMGQFQFLTWRFKILQLWTLTFAATKYGTVSIFVVTWRNSPKFCSRKIWDRFNFCL